MTHTVCTYPAFLYNDFTLDIQVVYIILYCNVTWHKVSMSSIVTMCTCVCMYIDVGSILGL